MAFYSSQRGTHFASGRCAIEPTQEDAWRDDNLVCEFCSEACMCIFWPRPKENLLALASDGWLQKSGVRAVARDKTDRKEGRAGS